MLKEHERREYLKSLDQEKREREEKRLEELKEKHRQHPKANAPGSVAQLREVWEETYGLDPQEFNPKTFFKLHDANGDGVLDEQELEALFTKELEKVYDPQNEEDDMVEMEEERLRMREHVMKNTLDDTKPERGKALEAQKKEYQQAVMEMSQKQKDLQVVEGQPLAGPNGELQFHKEMKKLEEGERGSKVPVPQGMAGETQSNHPVQPPQNLPLHTP
ncbi:hypothetical protein MATL_G00010950 [Megalops atlanticus]|uniref:Nucleobindin-1 n=1 Tax=Megalops atlanticus TaxID=7932 RepID=A0A9D3THI8_MEGAT|nr:hypothetical protein MATL_G00010950 [Megalops atlanticus]